MKLTQRLRSYVAISIMFYLSGCGLFASSPTPDDPAAPPNATEPSTVEPNDVELDDSEPNTPAIPVPDDVQVYQDPNGLFALAVPEGYSFEPLEQGLTFSSDDGGFAGEVAYQVSEDPSNDILNLEKTLKDHIDPQFSVTEWQKSGQRQPDGSVRLAWTGEDETSRTIDALSFIEVHGQMIFILNLYAIGQDYNTYSEDARIIAGTYVVRQEEADASAETTEDETAEDETAEDDTENSAEEETDEE